MSNEDKVNKQILYEAHNTPYAMHPDTTKMYRDLKKYFSFKKIKGTFMMRAHKRLRLVREF